MRKGLVSIRDTEPGELQGILVETCGPGQVFGVSSLMKPRQHSLTAVCVEDSEVLAIEARPLLKLCEEEPGLGNWFMMTIAHLYFSHHEHYRNTTSFLEGVTSAKRTGSATEMAEVS